MSEHLDIQQILSMVPHRYPFILVDRVLDYKDFDYLTAIKNVTINEPFFTGHFPEQPIMPGVLILEALAQASALLSSVSREAKPGHHFMYFIAGIDKAKFKHMVTPGDTLRLETKLIGKKKDFWRMQAEAYVEDKLACSAVLLSAVKEVKSDK